jgi:transcriptional regulator with XRE-family HTH domain
MNISKILKQEINRRGLSVTAVSEGANVPFSTVSEFLRGGREIGADKASKIATFMGFELVVSKVRREEMSDFEATVATLEKQGYSVDDETMEATKEFVGNLRILADEFGYHDVLNEEDAESASQFVGDMKILAQRFDYPDGFGEEDAELAASFCQDLIWIEEHWSANWGEDDVDAVATFVANLKWLEEVGEEATADRIEKVADFVANLKMKRGKKS